MIPKLSDELVLAASLKARGIQTTAFDGLTTVEQRKASFREAIAGAGAQERFGADFAKTYGEAL